MKTNKEGKEYFVEKIEEMMKRLSFEQVKLIHAFIKAMIE
jgi:hypothetical protein